MATKISQLSSLSDPAPDDLLLAVDVSDTSMAPTGTDKKVTISKLATFITPEQFGAVGDGVEDDTDAIQDALDYLEGIGGGSLYCANEYKHTNYFLLPSNIRIFGRNSTVSKFISSYAGGGGGDANENLMNGSCFVSLSPINSSTGVYITIENLGFENSNSLNVGAAVYDRCGTHFIMRQCRTYGFRYGLVLDQTELANFTECLFEATVNATSTAGCNVWIVNGPELNPGALGGFTNRISFCECSFNQWITIPCVVDDGGYAHSYINNNFNGGLYHLYLAGIQGCEVIGGEYESAAGPCVVLEYRTYSRATSPGGCNISFIGGIYVASAGNYIWSAVSVGSVSIIGCEVACALGFSYSGGSNTGQLTISGLVPTFASDTGFGQYATLTNRPMAFAAAAPSTGGHLKGEIVWNNNPSAGDPLGWRCHTSGTPGTWETIAFP